MKPKARLLTGAERDAALAPFADTGFLPCHQCRDPILCEQVVVLELEGERTKIDVAGENERIEQKHGIPNAIRSCDVGVTQTVGLCPDCADAFDCTD